MARKVTAHVDLDLSRAIKYVPAVGDNRKDPDPFYVMLRFLSGDEFDRVEASVRDGTEFGGLTEHQRTAAATSELIDRLIKDRVESVHNYEIASVTTRGKVYAPKTGRELLLALQDGPPSERTKVTIDLFQALTNVSALEAGTRGNLPDSSEPRTDDSIK